MLNITNTEESFNGCRERLSSVLTAMKSKVSVLEAEHNRSIKIENPAEFFLDKNYIHTAFEPFLLSLSLKRSTNSVLTKSPPTDTTSRFLTPSLSKLSCSSIF